MTTRTRISWAHTSWNPVTGCSMVSPGCEHCYAALLAKRYGWTKKPWTERNAGENVQLRPDRLMDPLGWRRPRRVFVNSVSDLFHEAIPDQFIAAVFGVMAAARQHTFLVLTKRPERALGWYNWIRLAPLAGRPRPAQEVIALHGGRAIREHLGIGIGADPLEAHYLPTVDHWPLRNVQLGVSVEDQKRADERLPVILEVPAALHWVSVEPMLGPVALTNVRHPTWRDDELCRLDALRGAFFRDGLNEPQVTARLGWVVVGGETGPGHRPLDLTALGAVVRQCEEAGVPVYVKQDSGSYPERRGRIPEAWWLREFPPCT